MKVNENLNQLKGWTNGGPLVKLVKGEGRATRARARSPSRAEAEACRDETRRDRDREAYALFLSFVSIIISCIKTTVTGN
jgi:hypothetical protein